MKEESTIIYTKLQGWYESFVEMMPNLLLALVIFILSYFAARGVRYLFTKVVFRAWENVELKKILGKIVQLIALIIGFMFALSVIKLDKTVTSILAGVGVLGLALGFAFQDIAANFISGLFMASKKPFQIGDMIEINGIQGTVKNLNLRTTQIETYDGNDVIIPNKEVFQNPIKNFVSTPYQRILINLGVSYSDDLEIVKEKTLELVRTFEGQIEGKEPQLFYKEFGDSSINFEVQFWVPHGQKSKYLEHQSNGIIAIKKLYDQEGFNIPFPIRTIDLSAHTNLFKDNKNTSETAESEAAE